MRMSLDIRFFARVTETCPHCGEVVGIKEYNHVDSGGRGWYPILEELGYYVPYEERTDENDWYGKDMELTREEAEKVYRFVRKNQDLYNASEILGLIAMTTFEEVAVVVNADW
jgi:hypothetical protein